MAILNPLFTANCKANPSFIFSANVNAGSSTYHKNNSFNANDYLSNAFQSSINLTRKWDNLPLNLSSNLRHTQNTQTKIVNLAVPAINFKFPLRKFFLTIDALGEILLP